MDGTARRVSWQGWTAITDVTYDVQEAPQNPIAHRYSNRRARHPGQHEPGQSLGRLQRYCTKMPRAQVCLHFAYDSGIFRVNNYGIVDCW